MDKFKSSEDYLERILQLKQKQSIVRAIDIANDMNYSKPSVSIALKKLKSNGFIFVNENNGNIELTEKGHEIAKYVLEKHEIITNCLIFLGVNQEIALEDACKIEHDLSDLSFEKLKLYYHNHIKKNKGKV